MGARNARELSRSQLARKSHLELSAKAAERRAHTPFAWVPPGVVAFSSLNADQKIALMLLAHSGDPSGVLALKLAKQADATRRDYVVPDTVKVRYCKPGRAAGTGELQRKRSISMPMNYYRGTGVGA